MRTLQTCLLIGVFVQAASSAQAPDGLAVAEAAAKANAATSGGKSYGEDLGRAFGKEHAGTVGACAKTLRRPSLTNFELFIQADRDGGVRGVLVKPETHLSTCVRDRLKAWKVPSPPEAAYWSRIEVLPQPR